MECSQVQENELGIVVECEDITVANWMLCLCGLDIFNIRAIWASRIVTGSLIRMANSAAFIFRSTNFPMWTDSRFEEYINASLHTLLC